MADNTDELLAPAELEHRLSVVQTLIAQPSPDSDPEPAMVGDKILVGNKHHAADVALLVRHGVKGVLNCASSGIRNLSIDDYRKNNIMYAFTNVAQDAVHVGEWWVAHQAEPASLVRADRNVVAAIPMVDHRNDAGA